MVYLKIWIHFVFSTKNGRPILKAESRQPIVKFMRGMTREQKIYLDHIAVMDEHIHCLVSLGKEQTISSVAKIISDKSADWINDNNMATENLSWEDYYAVSVSELQLEDVKKYIRGQEKYHHYKSFDDELREFFKRYGWRRPQDKSKKDNQVADPVDFSDLELK